MNKPLNYLSALLLAIVLIASTNIISANSAPFSQNTPQIPLTPEEQAWLANHPVITLSVDDGNPPLNFRDSSGELIGISIEYITLIASKIGVTVEYQGSTWGEALQKGLDHEVDGVVNASIKEDRKPYLNFSEPYLILPQALVTTENVPPVSNLSQVCDLRVAVIANSVRVGQLQAYCPDNQIIEIEKLSDGLKLVSEGSADAIFDELAVMQYLIEENLFTNLKIALIYYAQQEGESRLGLRNDSPELLSIINKAIAAITDEEHRAIRQKWLQLSDDAPIQREIPLTDDERAWLIAHPVIRVASDPQWAPIEFINDDGEFQGISIDYLKAIEGALGIQFEYVKDRSWQEIIDMARNGQVDMFSAVSETPERKEYLAFTKSYISAPIVIFTRSEITYIGNLNELKGEKVAVVSGYAIHEWLSLDYPGIQLIPIPSIQVALDLVQSGEAIAFVGNLVTASHYIQEQGYTHLKVAGETPYRNDLSMAVRHDWPELVQILQKALDAIPETQQNKIYQNWIPIKFEHSFDYSLLWRFGIPTIILLLLFVYWNRRLSNEIQTRKQVEIELIAAKNQAEAANEAKSTFLANMSHELRTPLNTILGFTQLLQRNTTLSRDNREDIRAISRSGEHLLSLIDDVLELAKIEAGRISLDPHAFDLHALLDGIEEMIRVQAEGKELLFRVEKTSDLPRYIHTDERKLRQVLLNLLSNAIKFTKRGSVALRADALPATGDDALCLRFVIEDTGVGIAPDEIEKLFEPFIQTASGQQVRGGTGLGLPISREFVRLMGGELMVTSQLGQGTTFTFDIHPKAGDQTGVENADVPRRVIGLSPEQYDPDGDPYRILIVDDQADSRSALSKLLKMIGFETREAANGQEAIEIFEKWVPHLIWMDMRMPVMDGFDATRRIKATQQGKKTIIVALTASTVDEDHQRIFAVGCDDFVRKPFKDTLIFDALARHLNVVYTYADLEDQDIEVPHISQALSPQDLVNLPKDLLDRLREGALIGHISGLESTIDQIAEYDRQVAKRLQKMVAHYDYAGILRLLSAEGDEP